MPNNIQSIDRAAAILEIIAEEGGATRLRTIVERSLLKKSTAHNILATLNRLGYVQRRGTDARYYLGERVLNLARVIEDDASFRTRFRPTLERIVQATGETVFLVVLSGDRVLYLDGIEPESKQHSWIGDRRPLGHSAVAQIFTAFDPSLRHRVCSARSANGPLRDADLEAVKTRGFALDLQGQFPGLNCVAVPIFEHGALRGSLGLRTRAAHFDTSKLNKAAWLMLQQAASCQFEHRRLHANK